MSRSTFLSPSTSKHCGALALGMTPGYLLASPALISLVRPLSRQRISALHPWADTPTQDFIGYESHFQPVPILLSLSE